MNPARLRKTWDALSAADPWRAILGRPGETGPTDAGELFASGMWEIKEAMERAGELGLPARRRAALDFGCGAGRLTQALAEYFDVVTGVDVSPAMLELARRHNRHGGRCRYVLVETADLRQFPNASFDFIYSNITLQHVPPRLTRSYLAEFLRLLAPDGLLMFHLPSHRRRPAVARWLPGNLYPRLARLAWAAAHPGRPVVPMYGVRPKTVKAWIEGSGGRVLAAEPRDSAGPEWVSFRYSVAKTPR